MFCTFDLFQKRTSPSISNILLSYLVAILLNVLVSFSDTCVDCETYTVDKNSRFPVLITYSEILYGAMFDFADVTGNSVLEH